MTTTTSLAYAHRDAAWQRVDELSEAFLSEFDQTVTATLSSRTPARVSRVFVCSFEAARTRRARKDAKRGRALDDEKIARSRRQSHSAKMDTAMAFARTVDVC
jgi:hypothetical protein